jgi:hypothetical protein
MTMFRVVTCAALLVLVSVPASSQPGPATLISPSATVVGSTIAFSWQSSATATWYQFWLGKADTTLVMEQWYTAEHAGCASGGTCTISLTPPITAGGFIWHIRTWSASGYGPWSTAHMFAVRDVVQAWSGQLPASRRFTLVHGGLGVLDNETGLVWERTPNDTLRQWSFALNYCFGVDIGLRGGWRLPTIAELRSLMDFTRLNPSLPAGHPFVLIPGLYWASTAYPLTAGLYYATDFSNRNMGSGPDSPDTTFRGWCVRGGVGM